MATPSLSGGASSTQIFDYQGIKYRLSNVDGETTAIVVGAVEGTKTFNIPSFLNGYKVSNVYLKLSNVSDTLEEISTPDDVLISSNINFNDFKKLKIASFGRSSTNSISISFSNCTALESVTIPDSVTSIGTQAFYNCSALASVTIPDSVTSISEYAFYGCSKLASAVIGNSVTSIGNRAFYNCSSLTSVTIPDSVTSIGGYAFYNCKALSSIVIPDSVTSIGGSAFGNCSSLESITLPSSLTKINYGTFWFDSALRYVYYGGTEEDWGNVDRTEDIGKEFYNATVYFYSETEPTEPGNYWHYVDGVPTIW